MVRKKQIICMVVILALLSGVANSSKVSASAPRQFEQLEFEKAYNEDLDCDGKDEKVICKQTDVKNDETKKTLTVYINDNIVFEKTLKCQYFTVDLADIDVDDNVQDLFITTRDYSAICLKTFYLQYRDSKLKLIQTIKRKDGPQYLNMAIYFFGYVSDDASFQLIANRPIGDAIGDYECFIPYKLINSKIVAVKTNTYSLTPDSQKYVYKAKKKFATYKSVYTGSTTAFKVNSGDEVRADKVYVSNKGKCYIRIINGKNVKGWIDGSQEDLFVKGPIWD
jgi:hypothetical protein